MMRRKKEIFLDFTSLLDVTMIILFFFIITYSTQTAKAVNEAEEKKKQADERYESAAVLEAEYGERIKELEEEKSDFEEERDREMKRLYGASERAAYNIAAMNSFGKGENIKIFIDNENESPEWKVKIYTGSEIQREISKGTDIAKGIRTSLESLGLSPDDVILADMIYDSSKNGSTNAYDSVKKALDNVRMEYINLYVSETNMSRMKEGEKENG